MNLRLLPVAILALALAAAPAADAKPKPKRADLKAGSLKAPTSAMIGGKVTVSAKVVNSGNANAIKTTFAVLLSKDGKADKKDAVIGSVSVKALKKGKSVTATVNGKVPANAKTGGYKLIACADKGSKVKEKSEANNCTTKAFTVGTGDASSGPNVTPIPLTATADASEDGTVGIVLKASDANDCELTFAVTQQPAHGSLGAPQPASCVKGSPSQDSVTVPYTPAKDFNGADAITYTVTDGHSAPVSATVAITVAPVPDAPVITSAPAGLSVTEGSFVAVPITFVAPDAPQNTQSLAVVVKTEKGYLSTDRQGSYFKPDGDGYRRTGKQLTWNEGNAQSIQNSLSHLVYRAHGEDASTDTITVTASYFTNGQTLKDTKTFNVEVAAANDAPEFVYDRLFTSAREDNEFSFSSFFCTSEGGFCEGKPNIQDLDNSGEVTATLTASHAVMTLPTVQGFSYMTGDGFEDTTVTIKGPATVLDNVLNGTKLKPDLNYAGTAPFTIHLDDGDARGAKTADVSWPIEFGAVNDLPKFTLTGVAGNRNAKLSVNGGAVTYSGADLVTVDDVDAEQLRVTFTASGGDVVTLSTTSGLTVQGGQNGTANVTVYGTKAAINAAMNGMVFDANSVGSRVLTIVADDLGMTGDSGIGGTTKTTQNLFINVTQM